jgi:tetratricopeptide (TPR) repeat protein
MAPYSIGTVWRTRAMFVSDRGLDEGPAVARAIAGYEAAIRLDPGFLWALSELCASLALRARRESLHGIDPEGSHQAALAQCDRAIALDPDFMFPKMGKVVAYLGQAEHLVSTGRSPEAVVTPALAVIEEVKKQSPTWIWIPLWLSRIRCFEATHLLEAGGDPASSLDLAAESVKEMERLQPSSSLARLARGEVSLGKARRLLARDEDPTSMLRDARAAFGLAVEEKPRDLSHRVGSALVEIAAIQWAMKRGAADAASFDAALALLLPLLDVARGDPAFYQTIAEIYELRAAWLLGRRKEADAEVARGLEMSERALALNPRLASALAGKGRLLLLRARQSAEPRDPGKAALQALTAAVQENPLIERTERRALEEAKLRASESTTANVP